MAKILSFIDTARRGSVGGITYLANSYCAIIARARTIPTNPNTSEQEDIRMRFKESSDRWRDVLLTSEQSLWWDQATRCPYQGPFGDYTVPGRNLFIATKTYRSRLVKWSGLTVPDDDDILGLPGWLPLGTINILPPSDAGTGFDVSVTRLTENLAAYVSVQRSQAMSKNVTYFKGPFNSQLVNVALCAAPASTLIKLRGMVADAKYFIKIRAIESGHGSNMTRPFIYSALAETFTV
jgi:hypothetical protein